ncbi:MAG: hypothetical protein WCJ56_07020 [bacterium]
MATINVRGIPQEYYDDLRMLAEGEGQSINAEAREIIENGIRQRVIRKKREEALRKAGESRRLIGNLGVDSLSLLHEGRDER